MVSCFPFGWIKRGDSENWQLFWNSLDKDFFIKSVKTKQILKLASFDSWTEAKEFSDIVKSNPGDYLPVS